MYLCWKKKQSKRWLHELYAIAVRFSDVGKNKRFFSMSNTYTKSWHRVKRRFELLLFANTYALIPFLAGPVSYPQPVRIFRVETRNGNNKNKNKVWFYVRFNFKILSTSYDELWRVSKLRVSVKTIRSVFIFIVSTAGRVIIWKTIRVYMTNDYTYYNNSYPSIRM